MANALISFVSPPSVPYVRSRGQICITVSESLYTYNYTLLEIQLHSPEKNQLRINAKEDLVASTAATTNLMVECGGGG